MENASKALLIAGAVLIVILLIGIGMLIYSKSTGVIDTAASTMNTQEIQAFNSQFTPYEGEQKGSSVRALISTVIANNGNYGEYSNKSVGFKISSLRDRDYSNFSANGIYSNDISNSSTLSKLSTLIETGKTYKITMSDYENGLIKWIRIEYK